MTSGLALWRWQCGFSILGPVKGKFGGHSKECFSGPTDLDSAVGRHRCGVMGLCAIRGLRVACCVALEKLLPLFVPQCAHLVNGCWVRLGESDDSVVLRGHRVAPMAKRRVHLALMCSLPLLHHSQGHMSAGEPFGCPHENIWKLSHPPPITCCLLLRHCIGQPFPC